jgi:hypothetical protein
MLSDRELWACANRVLESHGEKAPIFVAERIGALALAGDSDGIATWKAIASRLDQLINPKSSGPAS